MANNQCYHSLASNLWQCRRTRLSFPVPCLLFTASFLGSHSGFAGDASLNSPATVSQVTSPCGAGPMGVHGTAELAPPNVHFWGL